LTWMNGKFLLDTNIVIALSAQDSAVQKKLKENVTVFVPSIVLGELFFGAYRSRHVEENLAHAAEFAASNTILGCDAATARYYGKIKSQLRETGRPIPENDIWIAAIAQQHDLTLVTRDSHFDEVEDLAAVVW
jgi:tRNA(fMet)-specific endonuclease VapC